ncbi:MAG: response regulator [Oscillospiraceae bacterium]|nr:response regulator [Oscillospiraceae bacterium]
MDNNAELFFIPSLLKLEALGLERFSETSELSAGAYFELLRRFMKLALPAVSALRRFISRNGDIDSYKSLDDIIPVLKEMGCDGYVSAFYAVLGAYETGNWRLAAHHADMAMEGFDAFYSKISSAKRTAVESAPDAGLPLGEYIKAVQESGKQRKMVVLAVDDSPVILKSVSSVLSAEYKVYTLLKPEMLPKIMKQVTPELFLLDYKMPDISGFELIPVIRGFKEHRDTPIVFLTSEGTVDNVTAALALGASDFIVKPFNPGALREKIAKWIVRKEQA